MSAAFQLTVKGLAGVEALLMRLNDPPMDDFLDAVGALVVSQTQSRLADEKAGPKGEAWLELNPAYKARKKGSGGLLQLEGDLVNSITHLVHSGGVEVGSNLVYAAHHQYGSEKESGRGSGVPARPYLGVSAENMDEIERVCERFLEGLLNR